MSAYKLLPHLKLTLELMSGGSSLQGRGTQDFVRVNPNRHSNVALVGEQMDVGVLDMAGIELQSVVQVPLD